MIVFFFFIFIIYIYIQKEFKIYNWEYKPLKAHGYKILLVVQVALLIDRTAT